MREARMRRAEFRRELIEQGEAPGRHALEGVEDRRAGGGGRAPGDDRKRTGRSGTLLLRDDSASRFGGDAQCWAAGLLGLRLRAEAGRGGLDRCLTPLPYGLGLR
ncbi:hypothetical protein ACFQX4_07775 [Roseomonas sp. GCM10028921]